MPTTTEWYQTEIKGKRYLVIETAMLRIPLDWDPSSGILIAVGAPQGGFAAFPALVKGEAGFSPTFLEEVDFTALEAGDNTADSCTLIKVAEATKVAGPVYKVVLKLHKGQPGSSGTLTLNLNDYGTPTAGQILQVKAGLNGFEYAAQLCGDTYWPASLNSAAAAAYNSTLGIVPIPAQPFAWRPKINAGTVVAPSGSDARVDLIARLGSTTGNDVGRGFGIAGVTQGINIISGPPPGSADGWNRVAAGAAATIYLRAEQQAGSATYTTAATLTRFSVKVDPIPGTGS
jgi:hypothetical protein